MAFPVVASPTTDPTKVTGRRVTAAVLDFTVLLVPTIAIATSEMQYITRERVGGRFDDFCDDYTEQVSGGACVQVGDRAYFTDDTGNGASLTFLALSIVLLVVVQGLTGWTIGKLLTGLRTVREDGTRPGIGKAFVRWLLLIIDGLPCIPLVGFILVLTTHGHRRVGDMAAKTFVVRSRAAGQPIVVPGLTTAPEAQPWATPAPTPSAVPAAAAPQWDPQRGAYIQWDPSTARWLQWDDTTRTWSPIPGQ